MVTFSLGTQVMTPVSADISNEENIQSGGTPTICVSMDQTGCQFQVNAMQYLQMSNLEVKGSKELCLIDGGSNNGLAGAGMSLYEMA
eukprot:4045211-Ditylum_brightwellii.AAC.1